MAVRIFCTLCNKCPWLLEAIHKNVLILPCWVQKSSVFPASSPSWMALSSSSLDLELTSAVQHGSLHQRSPEVHRKLPALLGNHGLPCSGSRSCHSSLSALFSQHNSIPYRLPCSSHPLGICSPTLWITSLAKGKNTILSTALLFF